MPMGGGSLSLGSRPTSCLYATGVKSLYNVSSMHNMLDLLCQAVLVVNLGREAYTCLIICRYGRIVAS